MPDTDILLHIDVDRAFACVTRWLETPDTIRYLQNHGVAYREIYTKIQNAVPTRTTIFTEANDSRARILQSEHPSRNVSGDVSQSFTVHPRRASALNFRSESAATTTSAPKRGIDFQSIRQSKGLRTDRDNRLVLSSDISGLVRTSETSSVGVADTADTPGQNSDTSSPSGLSENEATVTSLSKNWEEKLDKIADSETRRSILSLFQYKFRSLSSQYDQVDDTDLGMNLESSDRLRILKDRILQQETAEIAAKHLKVEIRIAKRIALAELVGMYLQERETRVATPKSQRRRDVSKITPKDRFTDLIFPETKLKEGKDIEAHVKAKSKLTYWIGLGEPLVRLTEHFGYGIIALLPDCLSDKDLYTLPRPQINAVLYYIDSTHPGLKEKTDSLSDIVEPLINARVHSQRPVLEKSLSDSLTKLQGRSIWEWLQIEDHSVHLRHPGLTGRSPSLSQISLNSEMANADYSDLGRLTEDYETLENLESSSSMNQGSVRTVPISYRIMSSPAVPGDDSQDDDWRAYPTNEPIEEASRVQDSSNTEDRNDWQSWVDYSSELEE